jgi:hypothetical protein
MDEYNMVKGWDLETGIVRRSTLDKQYLKKIAEQLEDNYGVTVPALVYWSLESWPATIK